MTIGAVKPGHRCRTTCECWRWNTACNEDLRADEVSKPSYVFDQIGCLSKHKPNEITIFGKAIRTVSIDPRTSGCHREAVGPGQMAEHTRGSRTPIRVRGWHGDLRLVP